MSTGEEYRAKPSTVNVKLKVLEILAGNPSLSYSIIGRKVGITRERVRQIAKLNGYPPRQGTFRQKICNICGKYFNTRNRYCSMDCKYKATRKRIVINCHQCGKYIERTPSSMNSKTGRYFCNRGCYGKYMRKNVRQLNRDKQQH